MRSDGSQRSKDVTSFFFNKTYLVITIFLLNLLLNMILSGPYFCILADLNFSFENSYSCNSSTLSNSSSLESFLSQTSSYCFSYWDKRYFSSLNCATRACFPFLLKTNSYWNESKMHFSESNIIEQIATFSNVMKPNDQVCFENNKVSFEKVGVCRFQLLKDNIFRTCPVFIHVSSFVSILKSAEGRISYGNAIIFYVASLFVKSTLNLVVIARAFVNNKFICIMIGAALQLSWLSSQAWQIVISYRIWKSFKAGSSRVARFSEARTTPTRGHALVWALPCMCVFFTLCLDHSPYVPVSFRPDVGVCRCWFIDERVRTMYVAVPAALAESVALGFFLATLRGLRLAEVRSRSLERRGSRRHYSRQNQWSMIYMRVSFLTGASYILVTLVALYTLNYKDPQGLPPFIINTVKDIERFRGFEIFYIFVFKKKHFLQNSAQNSNNHEHRDVETIAMNNLRV